jgi:hypothetical protein
MAWNLEKETWPASWQRQEAFSDGLFLSGDALFVFEVSTRLGSRPDRSLNSGPLPYAERGDEATGHTNAGTA